MASKEVIDLAQKYQNNEITHAQLLELLKKLRNPSKPTDGLISKDESSRDGSSKEERKPMGAEERKLAIREMLQEKRVAEQKKKELAEANHKNSIASSSFSQAKSQSLRNSMAENQRSNQPLTMSDLESPKDKVVNKVSSTPRSQRPSSAGKPSSVPQPNSQNQRGTVLNNRSNSSVKQSPVKSNRTPVKKQLPSSMNDSYFKRSSEWNTVKEQKIIQRHKEKSIAEEEKNSVYTYKPELNPNSERILPSSKNVPIVNRIQQHTEKMKEYEQERMRKQEAEVASTCTFRPQIKDYKNPETSQLAQSKFRSTQRKQHEYYDENYTFKPQIRSLGSSSEALQGYTQQDAFQRLSRPITATGLARSRSPEKSPGRPTSARDRSSTPISKGRRGSFSGTPSSDRGMKRSQSSGSIKSEEESFRESFDDFLSRQKQHVEKKRLSISKILEEESIKQPLISRKSQDIVERKGESFMERMQGDQVKRERGRVENQRRSTILDSEAVFHPKILKSSQQLRGRSCEELSTGDSMKRGALMEAAKHKAAQEELNGVTFRPKLNDQKNWGTESRLKITSEPESYLERLRREQELKEFKKQETLADRSTKEIASCTFKPEVHQAPAFVKRIARTLGPTKRPKPAKSNLFVFT